MRASVEVRSRLNSSFSARRLRKLEAGILDSHGPIPNTPERLECWGGKLDTLEAWEDMDLTGKWRSAQSADGLTETRT